MRAFPTLIALAMILAACATTALEPPTIASDWRILRINGQATPGTADYHMEFAHPHWRGGFGCNGMMAEYRVDGDRLIIGRSDGPRFVPGSFIATERDCSEQPTGHFEYEGVPIIRQPMTVIFTDARHMRLNNGAGSFELERLR